jgi:hypothetical protein
VNVQITNCPLVATFLYKVATIGWYACRVNQTPPF